MPDINIMSLDAIRMPHILSSRRQWSQYGGLRTCEAEVKVLDVACPCYGNISVACEVTCRRTKISLRFNFDTRNTAVSDVKFDYWDRR